MKLATLKNGTRDGALHVTVPAPGYSVVVVETVAR